MANAYAQALGAKTVIAEKTRHNHNEKATVDRISNENHPLSGQAKDLGSAAVFLSLVLAALVWGTVAWQRFAV